MHSPQEQKRHRRRDVKIQPNMQPKVKSFLSRQKAPLGTKRLQGAEFLLNRLRTGERRYPGE